MGDVHKGLNQRNRRRALLDDLLTQRNNVCVIHYSCESFYKVEDGRSPRITSIAVRNLGLGQTASFSIHQVAERSQIELRDIEQRYNELERIMLDEFNEFVRNRVNCKCLHWNMRDSNYGFPAIEHGHRVLGGEPVHIPESNLTDLATLLICICGPRYIGRPRLQQLVVTNGISCQHFVSGQEEAEASEKKEYVKLYQSTPKKVDVLVNVVERTWRGTLKTKATWRDQYGSSSVAAIELLAGSWAYRGVSFFAIILTVLVGIRHLMDSTQSLQGPLW